MQSNWEHFRHAASVLVGPGPVKQRLTDAYLGHLRLVDAHALPSEVLPRFLSLTAALCNAPPTGGLSAVEVTIRKMSEQDAARHSFSVIEMLLSFSGSDTRESAAAARQLRLVGADEDDLPAFLSRA